MRLRVSILSVIIHSETVLYSWQNNGELVTRHCKQSNKANLLRKGYWNTWLSSRLIIQEHIVEYVERTLLKLLLKSFNIFTIMLVKLIKGRTGNIDLRLINIESELVSSRLWGREHILRNIFFYILVWEFFCSRH